MRLLSCILYFFYFENLLATLGLNNKIADPRMKTHYNKITNKLAS